MYDWFYHQILHHAPLWTCWCHSLTFSNTSASSQSQLTTSYRHHHHNNRQNVQYRLGTHIHWCTAEAKFEVTVVGGTSRCADMKKRCEWVNGCFWCWNILLCFFLNSGVAGWRSVSWNTAEAYFQEARLFSSLITTNINKKYLRKPRHDLDLCKLVLSPFYQTDNDELTITGKLLSTEAVTPCESPLMKPRAKCLNSNLTNMNNWE